jgi:hypothetical protein
MILSDEGNRSEERGKGEGEGGENDGKIDNKILT